VRNPVSGRRGSSRTRRRDQRGLRELVDVARCDLVLTTGGTGPRRATSRRSDARGGRQGDAGLRRADAADQPELRADRDPVAPGGGDPRQGARHQPAGQPKSIAETLEGLPRTQPPVHGIFAAVPYCIDLIGGPYIECDESVCKAFRPKRQRFAKPGTCTAPASGRSGSA
jgi:molybdopterin adenylyltransferase